MMLFSFIIFTSLFFKQTTKETNLNVILQYGVLVDTPT